MLLTTNENRVYGTLPAGNYPPGALFWSTPVRQPAGALVALQFDYRLSAATDEPCWLAVTLNGKGRSVTRQLCPEGMQGRLVEPLVQFLGDFLPDETVRSISWKCSTSQRQAIVRFRRTWARCVPLRHRPFTKIS